MLFKIRMFHGDKDWFTTYYSSRYTTRFTTQNTLSVPFKKSEHSRKSVAYIGPVQWNGVQIVSGLMMTLLNLK